MWWDRHAGGDKAILVTGVARGMPTEQLATELEAATEQAREDPDTTLLEVTGPPGTETFRLTERPLQEAVELAGRLGAAEVYLFTEETGDGDLGRAGVAFRHGGHVHTMYRESTTWDAGRALPEEGDPAAAQASDPPEGSPEAADVEPDAGRKRELADELLAEHGEQLTEGDEYRLRNRLEHLTVPRLLAMREDARRQAKLDPEEEERLARVVFRDGRFNRQYDPRDTRMLLDALAVDYDPETVRIEQVHQQAMSLLTVDE